MRTILLVSLAVLLLAGCASSFGIQVVQGLPEEVYLTFTKGTSVQVGEVYVLYHAQQNSAGEGGGDHSRHGVANPQTSVRHEVGRVRVVSITDETHALVKVLSGTAREGVAVKRAD